MGNQLFKNKKLTINQPTGFKFPILEHPSSRVPNSTPVVKSEEGFIIIDDSLKHIAAESIGYEVINSGFLESIVQAYAKHGYLVINPEDINYCLLSIFKDIMNDRAEQYRSNFVSFDCKMKIDVLAGNIKSGFEELAHQVLENVNPEVGVLIPDFTTTTDDHKFIAKMTIISSMEAYFDMSVCILCGLRGIKLNGTVADWVRLRDVVFPTFKKLIPDHDVNWAIAFEELLQEFINIANGFIDIELWKRIIYENPSLVCGSNYYYGWINLLWPNQSSYFKKFPPQYLNFDSNRIKEHPQIDSQRVGNKHSFRVKNPVIENSHHYVRFGITGVKFSKNKGDLVCEASHGYKCK